MFIDGLTWKPRRLITKLNEIAVLTLFFEEYQATFILLFKLSLQALTMEKRYHGKFLKITFIIITVSILCPQFFIFGHTSIYCPLGRCP